VRSKKSADAGGSSDHPRRRVTLGRPTLEWELKQGHPRIVVAGVDEVGRGCLAGPVVAAAVILPEKIDKKSCPWIEDITDSKRVRAALREELSGKIQSWAGAWALGVASVAEIDEINIFHASHLAMKRAVENLNLEPAHVLVDGKFKPPGLSCDSTAIIQGDLKSLSIAAASIVAKVWRDQHMVELDSLHPGYGFGAHKGYATAEHSAALGKLGTSPIHRRSFSLQGISLGAQELLAES